MLTLLLVMFFAAPLAAQPTPTPAEYSTKGLTPEVHYAHRGVPLENMDYIHTLVKKGGAVTKLLRFNIDRDDDGRIDLVEETLHSLVRTENGMMEVFNSRELLIDDDLDGRFDRQLIGYRKLANGQIDYIIERPFTYPE